MNLLTKLDFPRQTLTNDTLHSCHRSPHAQIGKIINNGFFPQGFRAEFYFISSIEITDDKKKRCLTVVIDPL